MTKTLVEVWSKVLETLKDEFSAFQYESWLEKLDFIDMDESGVVALEAPDLHTRNWVETYYRKPLLEAFAKNQVPVTSLTILASELCRSLNRSPRLRNGFPK